MSSCLIKQLFASCVRLNGELEFRVDCLYFYIYLYGRQSNNNN